MKEDLIYYVQQQIRTGSDRLKRFTHSISGERYPQRFIFVKLSHYVNDFLAEKLSNRMVIIPGFRGVGKTTVMAQLCSAYRSQVSYLFLSVEDAKNLLDAGISELMTAYEEIIGENLENIKKPLLIFLDEIQSDPQWAIALKSLFEKTKLVFFCGTGSSAVTLQTTSNLARRAIFETMPPICFTEYEMIRSKIDPKKGLKEKIRQAIYFSKDANEAFGALSKLKADVNKYWAKIDRKDIRKFLAYGTFPFALTMPNEVAIYDSISLLLDKIIKLDLPTLANFTIETLNVVKRILFVIAKNDETSETSLAKLEALFNINKLTIAGILDALEKAELLIKVPAYGSNMSIAKKPSKYLFMSPALRMAFFYFTGIENTYLVRQGKLLEDLVGGHLYREFIIKGQGAMRYDSAKGGADFILQILNKRQMIIEIGMGNKDKKQIAKSLQKISSDYNLVFSSFGLTIEDEIKTLFVPLDYFLLM